MDAVALQEERLWLCARPLDGLVEEFDGWRRVISPNAPSQFRNGVFRAVLTDDQVDKRIDAVIRDFDDRKLPFRWVVTPSCRPADLGARLRARGFEPFQELAAMSANPNDFAPAAADVAAHVEMLEDEQVVLARWLPTVAAGWGAPAAAQRRFKQLVQAAFAAPERTVFHFLARVEGEPAGTASVRLLPDGAHLDGASVIPAFRRRGVYRQLLLARMAWLRGLGVSHVTNHCRRSSSAPICERLGFTTDCEFAVYVAPVASQPGKPVRS